MDVITEPFWTAPELSLSKGFSLQLITAMDTSPPSAVESSSFRLLLLLLLLLLVDLLVPVDFRRVSGSTNEVVSDPGAADAIAASTDRLPNVVRSCWSIFRLLCPIFSVTRFTASSPGTRFAVMTLFKVKSEDASMDLVLEADEDEEEEEDEDEDDDDDDDDDVLRIPAVSRLETVSMTLV